LPLEVFTQRNFVAEFIRLKFLFTKMTNLLFEPPFGGIRGNIRTSSIVSFFLPVALKRAGDFTIEKTKYTCKPV